jgi:very-short-patch-repair endonuclease
MICQGTTVKGKPCTKDVKDRNYCNYHIKQSIKPILTNREGKCQSLTKKGNPCPYNSSNGNYCSIHINSSIKILKIKKEIPYEQQFASHEKSKYWSDKNGNIKPKDVSKGSHKKYWFNCDVCPHEFESELRGITNKNRWCIYCANKKLCMSKECEICLYKSFASHEKSKYWSSKNGDITPVYVFKNSGKKFWFNCNECNHEFESILSNITGKMQWCSYCANRKLCIDDDCELCFNKSFASYDKSIYWSSKNGNITPRDIFKYTNKKYWFKCDTNHEFENSPNKISNGTWCLSCGNENRKNYTIEKELTYDRSFASCEMAKYWSSKNGNITPKDVYKSSHTKYWFDCNTCKHVFESRLSYMSRTNKGCQYCANRKLCTNDCVMCFNNSFASHEKAKYWSSKNETVIPRSISKRTNKKYWFNCDVCSHEIEISPNDINSNVWCSYCVNRKLCTNDCVMCFNNSFASHEKAKYWSSKNKNILPRTIGLTSEKKYWFNCDKCLHNFEISPGLISQTNWCSYCSNQKLCGECDICLDKSFASHEKAKYWSSKNIMYPIDIFKGSQKKYWFDCEKCSHEFISVIASVTTEHWCPYCSHTKICTNNCKMCFDNSFASHEKAKYWSSKNKCQSRDVFKNNIKKYWFDCDKCHHDFKARLNSITNGSWCPYCANKKLCSDACNNCFNNSFASSDKVKYWSNKNIIQPREVFKNSNTKYWFKCAKQHEFESQINNVTNGSWCPQCVNKTERKLLDALKEIYPDIKSQFKVEWCKNVKKLPFDFCLKNHKIIIELDGAQHFRQVSNWKSPDDTHTRDLFKKKCANDNGYSIIRILQEDVLNDSYDWITELCKQIKYITNNPGIHNIYIGKHNEYYGFDELELFSDKYPELYELYYEDYSPEIDDSNMTVWLSREDVHWGCTKCNLLYTASPKQMAISYEDKKTNKCCPRC